MPGRTEASEGFVTVSSNPEIRIYYKIDGSLDDSKPILLFANSLAATTHLWDESVSVFQSDYTIVRYDMRFHGLSPLSSSPDFNYATGHSMEDLSDDVLKLIDHLHIKQLAAIVGLSIGAAMGVIFGAKYPDRVQRVVVVGTRATSNPASNEAHASRIQYGKQNGPHALGRQSISRWFDKDFASMYPERIAHAEKVYCLQSIEGYEASIAALKLAKKRRRRPVPRGTNTVLNNAGRTTPPPPPYQGREQLLTQVRTGHVGLRAYLFRRQATDSPTCVCGAEEEALAHVFLSCATAPPRPADWPQTQTDLDRRL
ncbi:hypothetical protein Sste5344_010520 [Sporothrix stenoceras]